MENITQMSKEQIWIRFAGWELRVVSEHDDGEPKRKHKKKRIAKKWLKRYGTWSAPLKPGVVVAAINGMRVMFMSRRTYCIYGMIDSKKPLFIYAEDTMALIGVVLPIAHHGNATIEKHENLHL